MAISAIEVFENNYVHGDNGCWVWVGTVTSRGYGEFYGDNKMWVAHRFAYEYFIGEIPEGLIIRHLCNNPLCVNPDHLEVGTHQDNMDDKVKAGRQACGAKITQNRRSIAGSANGRAKLTKEEVDELRSLYLTGKFTQADLSLYYDISDSQVSEIVNYKSWNG